MLTPCIEPVASKEHGEQEDDPRIRPEGVPEPVKLRLPRGVARGDDAGAVGPNHLCGVGHEERDKYADTGEHQEANLG